MAFAFSVVVRDLRLKMRFRRALRAFADLRPEMQMVGDWLVRDGRARLFNRPGRMHEGRMGRLEKSLKAKAFKRSVTITSVLPYARIQQEGGTVHSSRPNGMLAIPLMAREKRNHAWPRHWKSDSLFPIRLDGRLFLAKWAGKRAVGKTFDLVYLLVRSVTIPARPYLVKSRALLDYMRQVIVAKLNRAERGEGAA